MHPHCWACRLTFFVLLPLLRVVAEHITAHFPRLTSRGYLSTRILTQLACAESTVTLLRSLQYLRLLLTATDPFLNFILTLLTLLTYVWTIRLSHLAMCNLCTRFRPQARFALRAAFFPCL